MSNPSFIPIVGRIINGKDGLTEWITIISYVRCPRKVVLPIMPHAKDFFGRLKNEFFYGESWIDVSIGDFIEQLDEYLEWYNNKRIKLSLGGVNIMKYRESMNFVA